MFPGEDGVQDRLRPVVLGFWESVSLFLLGRDYLMNEGREGFFTILLVRRAAKAGVYHVLGPSSIYFT